jgi:hypothetical protein
MITLRKSLVGAVGGACLLALSGLSVSAEIACVGPVCWHTPQRYDYPADAGVTIHPNDWRWGSNEHYSWREHEGRGYWRGDRWMER